ncbi:unnamed protein product [Merluccius merluccius]
MGASPCPSGQSGGPERGCQRCPGPRADLRAHTITPPTTTTTSTSTSPGLVSWYWVGICYSSSRATKCLGRASATTAPRPHADDSVTLHLPSGAPCGRLIWEEESPIV